MKSITISNHISYAVVNQPCDEMYTCLLLEKFEQKRISKIWLYENKYTSLVHLQGNV